MGLSSSKLCRTDSNESKEQPKGTAKETVQIVDPRSPTGDITRTPIVFEKVKPYLETDLDNISLNQDDYIKALPLRNKLLKNLKTDPRSPTVGINRTPIFVEGTPEVIHKTCKGTDYCDSPLSIYSNNFSDCDSLIDVTAPPDPSVIVSEFNNSVDEKDDFDSLINQFSISDSLSEEENKDESNESKESVIETPLKVNVKPTTDEAQKLMTEILSTNEIDDGDFIQKIKKPNKDKIKLQKKLTVLVDDSEVIGKLEKLKPRTPLSNITSSANSPKQIQGFRKSINRNKIMADNGLENAMSPNISRIAQWDQDNTVII